MTRLLSALAPAFLLLLASPIPAAAQTAPADDAAAHAAHQMPDRTPPGDATATSPARQDLPPFIPPVTDEIRRAAFPDVEGHPAHDNGLRYYVLVDQLEWQSRHGSGGGVLDAKGWLGRDRDRVWFRVEGDAEDGRVGEMQTHVLYGRQFSRWWDVVGGIRQDARPGSPQTWAAFGVQGLAPYWFTVEATGYVGAAGRTQARLEVEYELLLTNRLVLQPLVEVNLFGKSDAGRRVGAGLGTTEVGFRLRYEIRREIAPYAGVTWNRTYGGTADFARDAGEKTSAAKLVAGLRFWF